MITGPRECRAGSLGGQSGSSAQRWPVPAWRQMAPGSVTVTAKRNTRVVARAPGVVVVAEVSGYLVDGQPDSRGGRVQGVGESLAGQHGASGQVAGVIEVRAGLGDEQNGVIVLDEGFHAQGGDAFGVAAGYQVVEQRAGDGGGVMTAPRAGWAVPAG